MDHPFVDLDFHEVPVEEMLRRSQEFHDEMSRRRSVRQFAARPVPQDVVERAVMTAGTAPSGAHKQPWSFVLVGDPDVKRRIREAAEREEKESYEHRMPPAWIEDLEPLGTDWHKPYLTICPWLVVVFQQTYGVDPASGGKRKHYYVQESVGISVGFLLAALHHAGLATLTHTPSPMGFLGEVLERPENERAYMLIAVGYPEVGCRVPDLQRKPPKAILSVV
ncbi:MAG: nitroreductase family protein [bacterium]|nr:nitroreductase family protein [bacterium]